MEPEPKTVYVAEPQKSSGKKWVVIVVATLMLGAVAGGFIWRGRKHATAEAKQEPAVESVLHLETFVVNLADDERAYLRIGIDIGMAHAQQKAKEGQGVSPAAAVRDTILEVITTARSDELLSADGKQKLKERLLSALQKRVPAIEVREVYFTEFLIQR